MIIDNIYFSPLLSANYAYHDVPVEILARETDNERPDFKSDGYYPFSVADYYTQV